MPQIFLILLKINLVLVLFAAAYYLILRRLTFYTINRLFLVFGIVFSTVYPFIDLTNFFHTQQQINQEVVAFVPKLNQQVNELVPSNFIANHWQVLSILFYVGVFLMALRLIIQFVSLYRMHKKSEPGDVANYPVRILKEPVSPFSFWQTVYINPSLHQKSELKTIIAHEQIHVKEWHSLDIILAELSVVFYWFNPGVWLMKKAVKENLEFITDQKILNKGIDKKTYQYSLLDVGNLTPAVAIVNNFNLSDLKKRIKMMNLKRSSRLTLSRYLLVTPVLLLTTLAFTISKKDIQKHLRPLSQVLVDNHVIHAPKAETALKKTIITSRNTIAVSEKAIDTVTAQRVFIRRYFLESDTGHLNSSLPGSSTGFVLKRGNIKGDVSKQVIIYHTDSIPTAERMRKIEKVKIDMQGDMLPGEMESKAIMFSGILRTSKLDTVNADNVIFLVNGKQITREELKKLSPDDIKNITVGKSTAPIRVKVAGSKVYP